MAENGEKPQVRKLRPEEMKAEWLEDGRLQISAFEVDEYRHWMAISLPPLQADGYPVTQIAGAPEKL